MSLLIHPGFHKTGTTWLQEAVFGDPRFFRSLLTHKEVSELLVRPHDFDFDATAVGAEISCRRENPEPGIVDVISSEPLSGNIFSGSRDSLNIARRLQDACGPAKILLTVRAQQPIMKSIYLQYVKRGGRMALERYLTYRPEPGYNWFEPGVLEFDRLAQAYADLFGTGNVMVLPQELLRQDRARFLDLLFEFAGVPTAGSQAQLDRHPARGVSPPESGVPLFRVANLFQHNPVNPEGIQRLSTIGKPLHKLAYRWKIGNVSASLRMKEVIKNHLGGRYGSSNRRLQRFAPVELAPLGYETED